MWEEILTYFPAEGVLKSYQVCPQKSAHVYLAKAKISSPVDLGVTVSFRVTFDFRLDFQGVYKGARVASVLNLDFSFDLGLFVSALFVNLISYLRILLFKGHLDIVATIQFLEKQFIALLEFYL